MDVHSPEQRSFNMSQIRSKNTKPEVLVRSLVHRMGYRFRLHRSDLPGKPDIVLPRHRIAINVHGCFWHRHPNCRNATTPVTNARWWKNKLKRNVARDAENSRNLRRQGWYVITIWECQIKDPDRLERRLRTAFERARN